MKENTTSGNQLGTRLICGLLTGVLGLVSATAVFAVSQQLQGKAELALQEIWSSLLLAFAGAFIFGAAAQRREEFFECRISILRIVIWQDTRTLTRLGSLFNRSRQVSRWP